MKLSAILIAAVSASPVAHDKDSAVAMSGKPMSGHHGHHDRPMSGHHDRPMSGHHDRPMSGHKDDHDFEHDMEEEWKEFQDMMRHGGADNNIMNVNFAPINTNQQNWVNINTEVETDVNVNTMGKKHGKDGKEMEDMEHEYDEGYGKDEEKEMEMMKEKMMKMVKGKVMKMMKYKLEMLKPYLPMMKIMFEKMTGMDCEEFIRMIEEQIFDGHTMAEVVWAYRHGYYTMEDMKMHLMDKWEDCEWNQMSMEDKMEMTKEFLARFGIDCDLVQAGIEEMIGMKFEEIKQMFEDHMADHSGDHDDDINVDDIIDDIFADDIMPM